MEKNKYLYAICKEECGSMSTTFYKYRKYRYEYTNTDLLEFKVYNEIGKYVFFFEVDFKAYFYTEKELRQEKLKRLNKI